jgi:capsular polysaccharide transport system permease protein
VSGGHRSTAESILRPIHVWLNVVNALLLRDIRARAGRFYTGYIVIFLMPFGHLAIALIAFVYIMHKTPPVGTDSTLFFGLSVLPFVIFSYPSRQIMIAVMANRPLLCFARVKIMDLIIARGVLEAVNGMAAAGVMLLAVSVASGEFAPRDPLGMLCALLLTVYLGIAWGAYHSLFAVLFRFWAMAFNLMSPLLWLGSGIIINVHGFPSEIQHWFTYNPLFQCVEYLRYSYYVNYPDELLDVGYIFWFATVVLAACLFLERLLRRQLLSV